MGFEDEVAARMSQRNDIAQRVREETAANDDQGRRDLEAAGVDARAAAQMLRMASIPQLPMVIDNPQPPRGRLQMGRRPPRFTPAGTGWWLGDGVALSATGELLAASTTHAEPIPPTERSQGNARVLEELRRVGISGGEVLNLGNEPALPEILFTGGVAMLGYPGDQRTEYTSLRIFLVNAVAHLMPPR